MRILNAFFVLVGVCSVPQGQVSSSGNDIVRVRIKNSAQVMTSGVFLNGQSDHTMGQVISSAPISDSSDSVGNASLAPAIIGNESKAGKSKAGDFTRVRFRSNNTNVSKSGAKNDTVGVQSNLDLTESRSITNNPKMTDAGKENFTETGPPVTLSDPSRSVTSTMMTDIPDMRNLTSHQSDESFPILHSSIPEEAGEQDSTTPVIYTNAFGEDELSTIASTKGESNSMDPTKNGASTEESNADESDLSHSSILHIPSVTVDREGDFISQAGGVRKFNVSGFESKDHTILRPDESSSTLISHTSTDYLDTGDFSMAKWEDSDLTSEATSFNLSMLQNIGSNLINYDHNETNTGGSIARHKTTGGSDLDDSKTSENVINHIEAEKFGTHDQTTPELGIGEILTNGHGAGDSRNTSLQQPDFNAGIPGTYHAVTEGEESTDSKKNMSSSKDNITNKYGEVAYIADESDTYDLTTNNTGMPDFLNGGYDAVDSTGVGSSFQGSMANIPDTYDELTTEGLGPAFSLTDPSGTVKNTLEDSIPDRNSAHESTKDESDISDSFVENFGEGVSTEVSSNPHVSNTPTASAYNEPITGEVGSIDGRWSSDSLLDLYKVKYGVGNSGAVALDTPDAQKFEAGASSVTDSLKGYKEDVTTEVESKTHYSDAPTASAYKKTVTEGLGPPEPGTHDPKEDKSGYYNFIKDGFDLTNFAEGLSGTNEYSVSKPFAANSTSKEGMMSEFFPSESQENVLNVDEIDESGLPATESRGDFYLQEPTFLASTKEPFHPFRPATYGSATDFERDESNDVEPVSVINSGIPDVFRAINHSPDTLDTSITSLRGLCSKDNSVGGLENGYSFTCQPDMPDSSTDGSNIQNSDVIGHETTEPTIVAAQSNIDPFVLELGRKDTSRGYEAMKSSSDGSNTRGSLGEALSIGPTTGRLSSGGITKVGSISGSYTGGSSVIVASAILASPMVAITPDPNAQNNDVITDDSIKNEFSLSKLLRGDSDASDHSRLVSRRVTLPQIHPRDLRQQLAQAIGMAILPRGRARAIPTS